MIGVGGGVGMILSGLIVRKLDLRPPGMALHVIIVRVLYVGCLIFMMFLTSDGVSSEYTESLSYRFIWLHNLETQYITHPSRFFTNQANIHGEISQENGLKVLNTTCNSACNCGQEVRINNCMLPALPGPGAHKTTSTRVL